MSRTSSRNNEMEVGRRTGLKLPTAKSTFISDDGLENAEQLFDAAVIVEESPNASLDGSSGKDIDTTSILAETAAIGSKKPKIKVRFSLGEDVADQFDPTGNVAMKPNHPVRKLLIGKTGGRESIDTMDLSSVSTAPSITSRTNKNDENDVEAARRSQEEIEIAAVVAAAKKQSPLHKPIAVQDSPINAEAPAIDDFDDDDDDDLIPPPPPDSPHRDDGDEELLTQPGGDDNVDISNINDDDNDGPGFEMNDDKSDDDESTGDVAINEQRRRKEKLMEKLSEKSSIAKGKKKKVTKVQTIHDESDREEAVKLKRKSKKKINPYSTHFSPKGIPGPRSYTQIPLSDLKADPPLEDANCRRSKRVRVPPLEFWRGEKPIFGGNDFGDEYDGVKNMPVVIGIAKPDPTPYKKRKVVPTVSANKMKKGSKRRGESADATAIIGVEEQFDSTDLRKKLAVNDGKVAHLWDERFQETRGVSTYLYMCAADKLWTFKLGGLANQSFFAFVIV
jgi:hypothetical protein